MFYFPTQPHCGQHHILTKLKWIFLFLKYKKEQSFGIKWDPKFKDRVVVDDREWEFVANQVGLSKHDVRRKWRSLRYQFLKELKKIPSNRSGSSQEYAALYRGKWSYFRAMLFLKDIVMPRKTDGNVSDIDETEEIENEEEDEIPISEQNSYTDDTTNIPLISSPQSILFTTIQKNSKRSKKQEWNNFEQQLINLETKKLAALTESPAQTDDEDMHFFKSILPYFKNMGPIQKLRVRNEIQNILIHESLLPQSYIDTTNSLKHNYNIPSVNTIHSTYSSTRSPLTNFHYSDENNSSI